MAIKTDNSSTDNREKSLAGAFLNFLGVFLISFLLAKQSLAGATRYPLWAGSFYPDDSVALRKLIHNLTNRVSEPATRIPDEELKALILPHAGYLYSGFTTAHASLVLHKGQFRKVIMLGSYHGDNLENGAIQPVHNFWTPLGNIPVHPDTHTLPQKSAFIHETSVSTHSEHSLEVVLPFLQYYLGSFDLIPITLGSSQPEEISAALSHLLDSDTLLVASTDLSHYLPYKEATEKDFNTINHILQLQDKELTLEDNIACGIFTIKTLINLARQFSWQPVLLHYSNSGDTAGGKGQVVGYTAIAFFATQDKLDEE